MEPQAPRTPRARRREDIVRIGGSVTVDSDEFVRGDVVVIGGSASINGEVDGEVVVVGGSARFGPQADVRGDITVIGGGLSRDPGAVIRGAINEVGFGDIPWRGEWGRHADWDWMNGIYPVARLTGTLVRITLLFLLTTLVLFVAKTPVEQIADRVAADPVKSWFVGFLAEMLFIPVLIMTAFVLAISIIGIPLLVLLPVAIVALLVVMLVGFTAVAYHIGRLLQDKVDASAHACIRSDVRRYSPDRVAGAAGAARRAHGRSRIHCLADRRSGLPAGIQRLDRRARRRRAGALQSAGASAIGGDDNDDTVAKVRRVRGGS